MKNVYKYKLFLLIAMFCTLSIYMKADVVAYWPFLTNGLNDVSGNGNALTAERVKFNGGAAVLDGSQVFFNTVSNVNLSAYSNVTVECFVKTTSASSMHMLLEISEASCWAGGVMMTLNSAAAG